MFCKRAENEFYALADIEMSKRSSMRNPKIIKHLQIVIRD